jgi:nucleoside-diphosphate-sugar epimerase
MRSIVIGGSGFLGRPLIDELAARQRDVVVVDRRPPHPGDDPAPATIQYVAGDIRDPSTLRAAFEGADEVYHLAGDLGTSELDARIRGSIENNIIGSLNVFESALAARVPRVFFASKVHVWLNAYTVTKHCAEQLGRLITQQHPVRICSLRYLNLFGPGQKLYPVRKVLPTFAIQALRGLPIQIYGDGRQTVDMLYVGDAARLTVDYLEAGYTDRAVDCGTGVATTVLDVAGAVNQYFGNDAGVEFVPMRRGETPGSAVVADTSMLTEILGPLDFTPFDVALKETLRSYADLDPHDVDAALAFHGLAQLADGSWS